jgi:hypothetical protein
MPKVWKLSLLFLRRRSVLFHELREMIEIRMDRLSSWQLQASFWSSISVTRSVGILSDGPARDVSCKFSSPGSAPQLLTQSSSVLCALKAIGAVRCRVAGALPYRRCRLLIAGMQLQSTISRGYGVLQIRRRVP